VQEFIPTTLGVALIEGYDNVGFETSLSKPFLRKEVRRLVCVDMGMCWLTRYTPADGNADEGNL
jgi:hypothetical protein